MILSKATYNEYICLRSATIYLCWYSKDVQVLTIVEPTYSPYTAVILTTVDDTQITKTKQPIPRVHQ